MNENKPKPNQSTDNDRAASLTGGDLNDEQLWRVVEGILTAAIGHTTTPTDALQALCEALIVMCVGCDVSLTDTSAYILRLDETMPTTPEAKEDAKAFVLDCWRRAVEIKRQTEQVIKKRQQSGACAQCGRAQMEHSSTNASMLRSSGIIVCESFKAWGAGGHSV